VAFSPDGKRLATASNTGKLWDVASRREIRLPGPPLREPLLFSPDGSTLLTGSGRTAMKLWSLATKRVVATLKGSRPGFMGSALSPDGKTLAIGQGNTIALWNLAVRQEVAILKGHTGVVYALAFSPDGNLLASAASDGTVRLWRAASWEEADPPRVVARGGDREVLLQWQPLTYATGYRVYRGPAGASTARLALLTSLPLLQTTFTDHGSDLVNGQPRTYAVAPLSPGAAGRSVEGPRVVCQATPIAAPPGFLGCSVDEGWVGEASSPRHSGSASFAPATEEILLRGCGQCVRNADRFYFLSKPLAGDFQIRVQALTRPTAACPWAKAGLMIRESLEPGARHESLFTYRGGQERSDAGGLRSEWRPTRNGLTENQPVLRGTALPLPILLRLSRRGDTLLPEYSRDGGKRFQPAGDPISFDEALPRTLYAGLAITSQDPGRIAEMRFSGLQIRER
jgi:hypothetical protein